MVSANLPNLDDLRLFCAVVEHGSFTAAAAHTNTTQPRVSRAVQRLEGRLEVTLLRRTPRRVAPTTEGRRYAEHARHMLARLGDVERDLTGHGPLAGPLSVSAPPGLGRRLLLPLFASFVEEHPGITLTLSLQAQRVDLIGQNVDVAIRFGPLPDSWRKARLLFQGAYHIYAAPRLVARNPPADAVEAITSLPCLVFHGTHLRDRWPLVQADGSVAWHDVHPALLTDDIPALIGLAIAGTGITILPDFLVADASAAGQLVQLTTPAQALAAEVFAVTEGSAQARASRLVDHLARGLGRPNA